MTYALLNQVCGIPLQYANRHGLVIGQTGTGKSVTLMRLAEQFSLQGVPVFVSDVKTDLGALKRSCPVKFYDLFAQSGEPLKITMQSMGADLLARSLELTDTQSGTLEIAFKYAADNNRALATIDDMRLLLNELLNERDNVSRHYGQVSSASIGVIMRALLRIESQGGNLFFGNPQFDVADLLTITQGEFESADSRWNPVGQVSILQAERLIQSPRVYGAFLLWLLTDIYKRMPEIGDIEKPRFVMFFDEAHLLFNDINPALLQRIELIVRLIRSKGVGVYFVTQSANDVPMSIREQLAHTIIHSRDFSIGQASFLSLGANGRPVNHGVIQVALPLCPLGALRDEEKPIIKPDQAPLVKESQWARMGKAEIVLLAIIITAIMAIGAGVYALWLMGSMAKALSIVITLLFVTLLKAA